MASNDSNKKGVRTSAYDHPNLKRSVIPSAHDPLVDETVKQARTYSSPSREPGEDFEQTQVAAPGVRTPDDEPRLAWLRNYADDGEKVDTVGTGKAESHLSLPLYVREEINPAVFVAGLTGKHSQAELEGMVYTHEDLPHDPEARYEWYEHRQNWRNRLIHGESEAVMTSLLDREHMAGSVQMIYFDPPFGIKYNSNFQPDQRSTDVKDGKAEGRPQGDVRTLKAFRDTWQNGVHSYFDSILAKLRLFRELLTESGSLFFQIGDENVARCLLLCDEVFGADNRVALIPFATSGGSSSKTLPSVADFLLWYAKDRQQLKYQQVYEEQDTEERMKMVTFAGGGVEFSDGTSRALTARERAGGWRDLPREFTAFCDVKNYFDESLGYRKVRKISLERDSTLH